MKKYHQLLLLITSMVSLSLFLIYRHEYNRLHYVLEVFNFFGQPCNVSDLQQTENILSHHDWGPTPLWQEQEGGHIYSAFLTDSTEAKALAVPSDEKLVPRNCFFWLEERKKPLVGRFTFSRSPSDERLFIYTCTMSKTEQLPFAVSFSYKAKRETDLKKVMLANARKQRVSFNATLCVAPSNNYSKRRLVEFLSYHKLIAIDSFVFYNKDIPHRIVKLITNLSTRLNLQATFMPWNFPKADGSQTRGIVENDCLLRTLPQSNYSATLELNEYIVPAHFYDFNLLMREFKGSFGKVSLPVQKFCITNSAADKPISMQNVEVPDDYNYNTVRYIHKNNHKMEDNASTYAVEKGLASIHKYVRCQAEPVKTHRDTSILKFATDLTRSTLFQFLLHDQI